MYKLHITQPYPQLWPELFETEQAADEFARKALFIDQWYVEETR